MVNDFTTTLFKTNLKISIKIKKHTDFKHPVQ